ncbi:related to 6-phosphofructo-2-kinase 1 [Saccharomycodes ludwigii]|uniref:Related to 6-phosphofructo-2-kinase 1 n=1 Tax=Saccharomycodes ludwigii TaxID=36035 RepID=A0A376B6R0_9ASCO|nr:hypothetical protein SCDLUD_002779 [Saccharomycodes ludwigii]KAH3901288.1 hypothetical protein SCDLUD_002779 [Saccharomycodes ludwigii]SSD60376.1 related to 6-phosphofructo-2-kinase 1 [Saccharomycodes ludwigii]
MFKDIQFNQNDDDSNENTKNNHNNNNIVEPCSYPCSSSSSTNIGPTDVRTSNNPQARGKTVRLLVPEHEGNEIKPSDELQQHHDRELDEEELPEFQKRPLSDTPMHSQWNSPTITPEQSSSNLLATADEQALITESETEDDNSSSHANKKNLSQFLKPMVPSADTAHSPNSTGSLSHTSIPRHHATATLDVPGLTKSKTSPDGTISSKDPASKLVIIMVGLPATGKSFITNKLSRFLNFSMYDCKVFNVGNTRREYTKKHSNTTPNQDSSFFDPTNPSATKLRDKWAMDTLSQLLDYLLLSSPGGSVGIFDATNTTKERRKHVIKTIRKRSGLLNVLFLESVCSDTQVVERNVRLKLLGPDYKGKDMGASLKDFKLRLTQYSKAYETVEDDENIPYIKMIDVGKKIISYNIQGFLASQTVYYLLNFNLCDRQIWITRSGESENNVWGRIGGDSVLTPRGVKYSIALTKFIRKKRYEFNQTLLKENKVQSEEAKQEANSGNVPLDEQTCKYLVKEENNVNKEFFVWTSMLKRAIQTAKFFDEDEFPIKQMKMLDELSAGDFENLTYEQIKEEFPEDFKERLSDKLRYRYPGIGGESYLDVINRLRPVITELERITDNVLIISHRVVARVLLGYFLNLSRDIYTNLDVPLHSVYCLETNPFGVTWKLYEYDEIMNDFREIPQDELNTRTVQQIGLVHSERRYSVVPTAPKSSSNKDVESNSFEEFRRNMRSPTHSDTKAVTSKFPSARPTSPSRTEENSDNAGVGNVNGQAMEIPMSYSLAKSFSTGTSRAIPENSIMSSSNNSLMHSINNNNFTVGSLKFATNNNSNNNNNNNDNNNNNNNNNSGVVPRLKQLSNCSISSPISAAASISNGFNDNFYNKNSSSDARSNSGYSIEMDILNEKLKKLKYINRADDNDESDDDGNISDDERE